MVAHHALDHVGRIALRVHAGQLAGFHDRAADGVRAWTTAPEARGELLGCWRTDLGALGRIIALREFDTLDTLMAERDRADMSPCPLGAAPETGLVSSESHKLFPFLLPVRPGQRGGVSEFRTYRFRPGDLLPTLRSWEVALERARAYADHLVANLSAIDGAQRITHVWAFDSLKQRARLRADAYAAGVWPPPGGPENIVGATLTIGLPETFSPLR